MKHFILIRTRYTIHIFKMVSNKRETSLSAECLDPMLGNKMFTFLNRDRISREKCTHPILANTFFIWQWLNDLSKDFKSYLLVSIFHSNPKAKQVFALSIVDPQALGKHFHEASSPSEIPLELFFWLLTLKRLQPLFAKLFVRWEGLVNLQIFWRTMVKAWVWKSLSLSLDHGGPPKDQPSYCGPRKAKINEQPPTALS